MKVTPFPLNTPTCNFEYFRVREGPNYFVSYYKNSSRLHYDPKECWRVLGVAKFTDTGKALKAWAMEIAASSLPKPELDMTAIAAEGFGPEAHEEPEIDTIRKNFKEAIDAIREEPNDNTRMVT